MATTSAHTSSAPAVHVTQGYSGSDLDRFRDVIRRKLAEQEQSIREAEETLSEIEVPKYLDAAGGEGAMREEAATKKSRAQTMIHDLKRALERMEAGTYGICRVTGRTIPEARLLIMPHATTVVEVKS